MRILSFEDRSAPFIDVFRQSAIGHGYDLLLGPPPAADAAFNRFQSLYRHRSVNPEQFELACFRRYFAAQAITAPNERVIMADSDLIIGCDFRKLPRDVQDFSQGVVGSIGITNGLPETDISPHFSIWTGRLLRQFCDFLIETYRTNQENLDNIHNARALISARVAISDMTLLYIWINEQSVPFLNSNYVSEDIHIDHNISLTHSDNEDFKSAFGRKAIRYHNGRLAFMLKTGRTIDAAVVHLQGRYKLGASALAKGDMLNFRKVSAYIAAGRFVRNMLP